jgi:hypothetical protein
MAAATDSTERDDDPGGAVAAPAVALARPVDLLIAPAAGAREQRTPSQVEVRLPPRRAT